MGTIRILLCDFSSTDPLPTTCWRDTSPWSSTRLNRRLIGDTSPIEILCQQSLTRPLQTVYNSTDVKFDLAVDFCSHHDSRLAISRELLSWVEIAILEISKIAPALFGLPDSVLRPIYRFSPQLQTVNLLCRFCIFRSFSSLENKLNTISPRQTSNDTLSFER